MPQYDDLLQSIRGRHPHPVLLGQRVGHFFDIHIRCLGFFGVYHADAMVPFNAAGIALYLVGVKDQYQLAPPVALVVAQDLNEPVPGGVQVGFRQLGQLLPRKDDIVSIHQQIFRPFGQGRRFPRLGAIPGRLWGMQRFAAPPLDGPVGHLKNAHQLFILQKGAPVGLAALPGHGRFLRLLVCLQHIRLDMRHTRYLIPPHGVSGPSAAKDRIRRIRGIGIAVVAAGGYHFLRVAAGGIAIRFPAQPSSSAGVPQHLSWVVPQGIQRRRSPQGSSLQPHFGRLTRGLPLLYIMDGPAQLFGRHRQGKAAPRLQKDTLRHAQSLPHRPVGRLPEIPALGVLLVGPSSDQRDLHIGDRGAGQYSLVGLFGQMGQDQPLPVQVQLIGGAVAFKSQPAAAGQRLHQQVHLGVVTQRLIVTDALNRGGNGLLVKNAPLLKADSQSKALHGHALQNLPLDLSHQPHPDLPLLLLPLQVELRVLLLQLAQLCKCGMGVGALRQRHPAAYHRLQQGRAPLLLGAKTFPSIALAQAGYRGDRSGRDLLHRLVFGPVIQPYLGDLLPARQGHADLQCTAGHLQVGQPAALRIGRDFIHSCREVRQIGRGQGQPVQALQQLRYSLLPQRRAKPAGEPCPPGKGGSQICFGQCSAFQVFRHQPLIAQRQCFLIGVMGQAGGGELPLQLLQNKRAVSARLIHLVHKNKSGDAVPFQQAPQRFGVGLHAVRPADNEHRVVQHRQRPLHLRAKVSVPGGIQQCQGSMGQGQPCLLGKDGDPPAALQGMGVQESISMVYPPGLPQRPGPHQHSFGQGGLAAVHMGHQPQRDILLCHGGAPFPLSFHSLS